MKPIRLALLALCCPVLLSGPAAASTIKGGYVDLLGVEAVGNFRSQQYDAYRSRDENEVFVGTRQLDRQTLLAAGLGLRLAFATANGLRFSGEGSLQGGRLVGDVQAAAMESTVLRAEVLAGLGYQLRLGRVVLHVAGIFGGDYTSLKLAPPESWTTAISLSPAASAAGGASVPGLTPLSEDVTLKRWAMRLGAQAGAHLQVSKLAALYGDVTFDYDGQWRSRFGIAIGDPGPR